MTRDWRFALKLWATVWIVYSLHWSPYIVREHFPAITLAEDGTLNVERFLGWSEDLFRGPQGGAYINNNPGASIAGAVPLVAAGPLLARVRAWNERQPAPPGDTPDTVFYQRAMRARLHWYFLAVAFVTVAGLMAPVTAVAIAALGLVLVRSGLTHASSAAVSLLAAFGTPLFFRTGYLNHNLLVAVAALLGGLALWGARRRPLSPHRALIAGLLGGFAVLCDYTGFLVLGVLGVYTLVRGLDGQRRPIRAAAVFVAGALPGLLGLFLYQRLAFGYPALPSQHFMPAIEQTAHGYRGIDWPSLELAWANFFDPRFGLFVYCPLLLLAFGAPFVRRGRYRVPPRETALICLLFALFVLFCAANQYSSLQWTTGMRYLIPVVPGLLLLSVQVLQAFPRALAFAAAGLSVLENWTIAIAHRSPVVALTEGPATMVQLSWLRRMREMGLVEDIALPSVLLLSTCVIVAIVIWRGELRTAWRPALGAATSAAGAART